MTTRISRDETKLRGNIIVVNSGKQHAARTQHIGENRDDTGQRHNGNTRHIGKTTQPARTAEHDGTATNSDNGTTQTLTTARAHTFAEQCDV
jgi:hypothetical protein